ncbi:MAG: hypothetical protein DWQ05_02905 [Calditrichaeota bacterium]|nr:MAG: hypothetical protein DWQ05_02905 [Calditrichota bacterium]
MQQLYYFANQVYQFSNILPLYKQLGGICITHDLKRFLQMRMYMRNLNATPESWTFLNTPPGIIRNRNNLQDLEGVLISLSNIVLNTDKNKCKSIFIGHGTGDKPYGGAATRLESFDFHFVSGDKHLEKLRDSDVDIPEEKLIKIGNLRFDAYVNGNYNQEKEADRLGIVDRSRKNVLYAPTWRVGGGTFKKYIHQFCREITEKHNLIVRPHHHDRRYIPHIKLWAKRNGIRHVYFSNPAAVVKSDTMADFCISDIMVSDTSSILYEYLIAKKPIIVIQNAYKKLHKMPPDLDILQHVPLYSDGKNIVAMIDEELANGNIAHLEKLLKSCFYFNDGKSTERAMEFVNSIL